MPSVSAHVQQWWVQQVVATVTGTVSCAHVVLGNPVLNIPLHFCLFVTRHNWLKYQYNSDLYLDGAGIVGVHCSRLGAGQHKASDLISGTGRAPQGPQGRYGADPYQVRARGTA